MEGYATTDKDVGHTRVRPSVVDYDEARRAYAWEAARRALDGCLAAARGGR